jgi:hypothetical protein
MPDWRPAVRHYRTWLRPAALVAFCVLVWIWRRPHQLLYPYVWSEESYVLRYFLDDGWTGVLKPLQGYITLPPSVLIALAADISFAHLPTLTYAFALVFFIATLLIIVVPDSRWGDWTVRAAMAVSACLVPVNPEVFGVLLYSFWWSTLWPISILGWKRTLWPLRAPLLAIAALSSPSGGALFLLFAVAYLRRRQRHDLLGGLILFAGFLLQSALFLTSRRATTISGASPSAIIQQVLVTGGYFEATWLVGGRPDLWFLTFVGFVFLLFLTAGGLIVLQRTGNDQPLFLAVTALLFTVMSSVPAPLLTNPINAGPRYYFLPFVLYGWTLLSLWTAGRIRWLNATSATLLILSLLSLALTFSRTPDTTTARRSWPDELRKCAASTDQAVNVPIYFAGADLLWTPLVMTPAQCRTFIERR